MPSLSQPEGCAHRVLEKDSVKIFPRCLGGVASRNCSQCTELRPDQPRSIREMCKGQWIASYIDDRIAVTAASMGLVMGILEGVLNEHSQDLYSEYLPPDDETLYISLIPDPEA